MGGEELNFGVPEGVNETTLNSLGLAAILVFGFAMLILPRRYAIIPMVLTACLIAPAQRVAVFTLNFTLLRILVVFGVVRVISRGELLRFGWKALDSAVTAFTVTATVLFIVLWGTADAVKYRSGWLFDAAGMYFLFRTLIRDWRDIDTLVAAFSLISIPVALAFIVENRTGHNMFAYFGGVPELTLVRDGKLRCQGAFAHPILAGCFWAVVLPLIISRFWNSKMNRVLTVLAAFSSLFIIGLCQSSTPLVSVVLAGLAGFLFLVRRQLRLLRWSLVVFLAAVHMMWKHPVWYLFSKVDLVGGSTGWHRFWIVDIFVTNFSDWWLMGTVNPFKWVEKGTIPILDVTNQYVAEGINAGLLGLALFMGVIVIAFRDVGRLWRCWEPDRARLAMAWAIGVALFVHVVNFFGVAYFCQIVMLWYLTLAMIGSLVPPPMATRVAVPNRLRRSEAATARLRSGSPARARPFFE